VTTASPDLRRSPADLASSRHLKIAFIVIAAMTALRIAYASLIDLRTDEAYYWTWSKEHVLSFLDLPPMIACFLRFFTSIFFYSNF
jgi:hypothetical protein